MLKFFTLSKEGSIIKLESSVKLIIKGIKYLIGSESKYMRCSEKFGFKGFHGYCPYPQFKDDSWIPSSFVNSTSSNVFIET